MQFHLREEPDDETSGHHEQHANTSLFRRKEPPTADASFPPMDADGAYLEQDDAEEEEDARTTSQHELIVDAESDGSLFAAHREEMNARSPEAVATIQQQQHEDAHSIISNNNNNNHSYAKITTDYDNDAVLDDQAMSFSQEASDLLQTNQLEASLEAYQQAADCYLQQQHYSDNNNNNKSLVAACNAAGCFRNMGAVSRLLHNYGEAVRHLQCAEELYLQCRSTILLETTTTTTTANAATGSSTNNNNDVVSEDDDDDDLELLCLDLMIAETMQSRANFHFQHQKDTAAAIQCHEDCLQFLLNLRDASTTTSSPVELEGVSFTPLPPHKHTELLIVSLETLGGMYRTRHRNRVAAAAAASCDAEDRDGSSNSNNHHPNHDNNNNNNNDLATFQAALSVLQQRHRQDPHNEKLRLGLTKILRHLSEIYVDRGSTDAAVDALHDAMDVELSDATAEPSQSALAAMDKMGLANEQRQRYDKALACYEKALLARSRFYGDHHIDVAKSLINVARVMELQGNSEGSLDLYKAAHSIYAQQITSTDFALQDDDDCAAILQLIPNLLEQERFEDARAYLTKALALAEDNGDDDNDGNGGDDNALLCSFDKSRIYFDLGQAYMGLKDYVSATICLVEAAKEEGEIREDQVMVLLQRVEQLQREQHHHHHHLNGPSSRSFDRTLSTGPSFAAQNDHKVVMIQQDGAVGPLSVSSLQHQQQQQQQQLLSKSSSREIVVSRPPSRNLVVSTSRDMVEAPFPQSNVLQEKADNISRTDFAAQKQHPSSGSTLPTLDLHSDTDFRGDAFGAFFATSSPEGRFSPRSEMSSLLQDSEEGGAPKLSFQGTDDHGESSDKLLPCPLIGPRFEDYYDDEPGVLSSDQSNVRKNGAAGGRTRGLVRRSSPRKGRDDSSRSVSSSQRKTKFGGKLRLRGRHGFQSLPEDDAAAAVLHDAFQVPPEENNTDDDSLLNDAPVDDIYVENNLSDDDISGITLRIEDPNSSRETQEWWWGVTAEGFGRWFPASYVSQAVQAADAFLSAKAIHSKSKETKHQAEHALEMLSDDETVPDEAGSHEPQDFLSNVGITSTKASRAGLPTSTVPTSHFQAGAKPARSPHHTSLFSSAAPQHFTGGKDVKSEIAACRETLVQQQKDVGKEHATVATSLFTLAVLYSRDTEIDAAIECATEALRIQQANGDFVDATRSLHFLADLHLHHKQFKQAMLHYSKARKLETSHFGYNSDETARTLNCIGTVKSMQNEFREAMESHEEALRILKECHGEDLKHPLVTETLCQIGSVYYRERNSHTKATASPDGYTTFIEGGMLEVIGRAHEERGSYKMAIAFFEEKLRFLESKDTSRENLEDAASTLNGLGMLSARAGLLVEAIDFYERALSIQLQLGCDEVHLATARVLTGAVQFQLGNWRKALKLLQDAVICLQEELGERHETVAATHYQIGIVQAALCEFDLAMDSLNEALEIQHELLGDDHPATLRTRREIGNLYGVYKAELPTAFQHFNFVLEGQKRLHGERHPNIAETLHSIGCAHAKNGDYTAALRALEECYYMRVEFLGWDHPLQATTLHVIARIHMKRGRLKKAIHICDVVLGIRKDALTERHIDVARALTTKGSCLVAQGDTDKGFECLSEALAMAKESVGSNHPAVADIHSELGALHLRKCQFDEARNAIQKALDIYCYSNLDDDYDEIVDAKEKLDRVQRDEMLCV